MEPTPEAKDESTAYLEFLNEEVGLFLRIFTETMLINGQAAKFSRSIEDSDEVEMGEDNFLDSPLDKIEPYQLFKATMLRKFIATRER